MVADSTQPPYSSMYGEMSVPPPPKLMRSGALLRMIMAGLDVLLEDVVAVRSADVDEKPVHGGAVQMAAVERLRQHVALQRQGAADGHAVEQRGLQHVDAGVDPGRCRARLLGIPDDALSGVDLDRAVGARIRHADQGQRPEAAAVRAHLVLVEMDEVEEVRLQEGVAVQEQERFSQQRAGETQRAPGPERRALHRVTDAQVPAAAVAEPALDLLVQVPDTENDIGDPMLPQELDLVLEEWLVAELGHRLRPVTKDRTQPHTGAAGEDHCLHRFD